eukprot:TRINITY_DN3132_c0_g4_i1.p1 TRINITY_DN3132_c0_g4~~TRINITY_DN3132_c0_g4_i1.p1  ORF type:complete len:1356 (-),score=176.40 TRINITY_DN3132_c0_g4_i1:580-4509(-)
MKGRQQKSNPNGDKEKQQQPKEEQAQQQQLGSSSTPGHRRRESVNPLSRAASTAATFSQRAVKQDEEVDNYANLGGHQDGGRVVYLNIPEQEDPKYRKQFANNSITTSKYNILTFLPIFLFEMFSRLAYLYFLAQACLSWWEEVSPFNGYGSTMALLFVLIVGAVKSIVEDIKRHAEDHTTNNSQAHSISSHGQIANVPWKEVKVGDILMVQDDELVPADLVCLYSHLPDDVCFVKTTNLDGETNLKIRKPVDLKEYNPKEIADVTKMHAVLQCEPPNSNLHHFKGRFSFIPSDETSPSSHKLRHTKPVVVPVTMNEILLRGCMLKNSGYILGLVVYTGRETRIQMNSAKPPLKVGSFDRFLNIQIAILITAQMLMCVILAIGSYIWREEEGKKRYWLFMTDYSNGNWEHPVLYIFLVFFTFWILLSYMVPISLFVTMEIVKFWQAFIYINNDPTMKSKDDESGAIARNSNLNEDLGKVEYVFSDKTGTLTANEMTLRMIAIKGQIYGRADLQLENRPELQGESALKEFDADLAKASIMLKRKGLWESLINRGGSGKLGLGLSSSNLTQLSQDQAQNVEEELTPTKEAKSSFRKKASIDGSRDEQMQNLILGSHLLDFWSNICICHSLIVEENPEEGEAAIYQGPSPDEVALVQAARQLGFEFLSRTANDITLSIMGIDVKFEILNVMEFTSERQRMSVIAKSPDGTIKLYSKGSDNAILSRLSPSTEQSLIDQTNENLHVFATQGLRTLGIGVKVLSQEVYDAWDIKYQEAAQDLENRDQKVARVSDEIEQDLELVGVSAIEDKLQEAVPEAIDTLLQAGIKVWMITGDKQETAINIAISCKLFTDSDSVLICNAASFMEARMKLQELLSDSQQMSRHNGKEMIPVAQFVIDGKTLSHILGTSLEEMLAEIGAHCAAVVVCRSSPSQKAAIVRMMRMYELKKAEGRGCGKAWRRHMRRLDGQMLAIGDGANDVAMIQEANVGVGIFGKEGRQAVNNSDYAIVQFSHLVRLLLVHGQLSQYRLARLIKYSFYKNMCFAMILFLYQFFCGFSGQTLVDDISAAMYNVVFTSLPVLLFSLLDKPVDFHTLIRFPQTYNRNRSLTTLIFWKTAVISAVIDGLLCFFIPYLAAQATDNLSQNNIYSVGKTIFLCILGVVTLEITLVTRFWTWIHAIVTALSYFVAYLYILVFPPLQLAFGEVDTAQVGVGLLLFSSTYYWFTIIVVYAIAFGWRFFERTVKWLFFPDDNVILAEKEKSLNGKVECDKPARIRMTALGIDPNLIVDTQESTKIVEDEDGHDQGSYIPPKQASMV